ncbi:MAG: diguanylate cyclase [Gammaproteobacteria bacterium]|nr:diguanylate cyclase [Gammaproteobacteria bacterium]
MFSFRNKLILAFILFGIMLIAISSFLLFKTQELSLKANNIENAKKLHISLDNSIELYIRDINDVFNALENSTVFQNYLNNPELEKNNVNDLFLSLASSSGKYMQFRYIDKNGMEKVRVNRNKQDADVLIVDAKDLQNKKTRYYFTQAMKSNQLINYSKIDLNIEHGIIEKPIKPVLRATKKVLQNNKLVGILVINVFMENFLKQLIVSPNFDIYLIDKNGNFIIHPDNDKAWNHYLNGDYILEDDFALDSACILNNIECQTQRFYAKNIVSIINPDAMKLIIQPKIYQLHQQIREQFMDMLYIYFAVLTLSFPIAYLFSMTPTRLKREVDQLNKVLEKKIQEKVTEVETTNKSLEKNVLQRTRELEEANTKLYKQATIDFLTKIPNRRYFLEMSDRYLQVSHRKRQALSIILFDIDFFKKVNDTYGHDEGDLVLKFITKNIGSILRRSDIFGRLGGEEFAIALLDANLEQAAVIAEKLRLLIQDNAYTHNNISIKLTISLGVSQAEEDEQEVSMILTRADLNLYQAKDSGRNKVVATNN